MRALERRRQRELLSARETTLPSGAVTRSCARCLRSFTITADELRWFEARGFALPRRCRPCRATRRLEARVKDAERQTHGDPDAGASAPDASRGDGLER